MNATLAREQFDSFKNGHPVLAQWLGTLPCEKQVIVLSSLLKNAEMKKEYPELCKLKFTVDTYTRSWFTKPSTAIEDIAADLNHFYGTTEQIPVEVRELLIESKLMEPVEEEVPTPDDLFSEDADGQEGCDNCACAECTCSASVTGIVVPYIFMAGNRTFKVESANRDEFITKLTSLVMELKRDGYAEDMLPPQFRHVSPEFLKIVSGTIYDQRRNELQADPTAGPTREYAAKKSTGGVR